MKTTTPALAAIACLLMAAATHAADVDFGPRKGLEVDGDGWKFQLGGRIHADSAWYDEDVTPLDDNADFRRARVRARLNLGDDWRVSGEYDVAGTNTGWKTTYIEYRGLRRWRFTGGNHTAPMGLAELASSNDEAFMERPLAGGLQPGLLMGISARTWGRHWTFAGGYFGDEMSNESGRKSEGEGAVARVTFAPIRNKRQTLHFGIASEYRTPNEDDMIRLRNRPESYMTDVRLIDTGNIQNVDDTLTTSVESALLAGPLTLQAEWVQMAVSRDIGSDLDFSGGWASASVMLTGERRRYSGSRGVIKGPRVRGDWGALEAAVRYGSLDLEDEDVTGGEQTSLALGLNWYVNRNVRLMLNYIQFEAEPNRDGIDEDGSLVSARIQLVL